MAFTETLELSVEMTGPHHSLLEKMTDALARQLKEKTGLSLDEVTMERQRYEVSVQTIEGAGLLSKGKPGEDAHGGSDSSFDDALREATGNGDRKYNKDSVTLRAKRTIQTTYFIVQAKARALDKEEFLQQLGQEERRIRERYGTRANANPESVDYTVSTSSADYRQAGVIPAQLSRQKLIAEGKSNVSLDEAVTAATTKKGEVKSTVYEGIHKYRVYGMEESTVPNPRDRQEPVGAPIKGASAPATARVAAAVSPAIVTSRNRGPSRSRVSYSGSTSAHMAPGSPTVSDYV